MVIKTITMLVLYFVPYIFVAFGIVSNPYLYFALWMVMGVGMAGIGLSIMHDANHGAYSQNQKVNTYLGNLLHFVGGSAENWKIQHNVLHHSFTNIEGHDEDISPHRSISFFLRTRSVTNCIDFNIGMLGFSIAL